MSLIKWEPFDDFDRVLRNMSFFPTNRTQLASFDLAVDVYEDGNNLVAEMNLPGLNGDDIDVEVDDNHLRVSGKREEIKEKREKSHYAKEIRRGSFERVIPLPNPVDQSTVDAKYSDGVLTVVMPKKGNGGEKKVKVTVT